MKIVVDTNIVFSAILNTRSNIGQLILTGSKYFSYFSISQLSDEIYRHKTKILKKTGYTDQQFSEIFRLINNQITYIDEILIPDADILKAYQLVKGIDENDTLFVALAMHLHTSLWTGDKLLTEGLKQKGFKRTLTTATLYEIFIDKESRNKNLIK